ncbi:hypothetical protein BGW41_007949, partial [Actinomortierella wolfii]
MDPSNSVHLLYLKGLINNHQARCLVDSGSTSNFLSKSFVSRSRLKTTRLRQSVTISLADGSPHRVSHYCCARVRLHPEYEPLIMFYVADVVHDVVLGKPWLAAPIGIIIDWRRDTVLVGRRTLIQGDNDTFIENTLMSATSFKRAIKRNPYYLCVVRQVDDTTDTTSVPSVSPDPPLPPAVPDSLDPDNELTKSILG